MPKSPFSPAAIDRCPGLLRAILPVALVLALVPAARAEKADREKPIQADSDKLTLDNLQKISTFEGNVVIIQGTIRITADRVMIKEDKDGFRHATGYGTVRQTTFRQKRDDVDEYIDGTADRFEYDTRLNRVELFGKASLHRSQDDVKGEYIAYDTQTEFFRANGSAVGSAGPSPGTGRVHVVIQPQQAPAKGPAPALDLKRDDNTPPARP